MYIKDVTHVDHQTVTFMKVLNNYFKNINVYKNTNLKENSHLPDNKILSVSPKWIDYEF